MATLSLIPLAGSRSAWGPRWSVKSVTDGEGKSKKVAVKRVSQEALRAEIGRDARALSELTAIHPVLTKRKVDKARLDKLLASAEALAGKLAERASIKGGRKQATAGLHDAVSEQKQLWGACYRILSALGREDTRVGSLLAEASRPRSAKKAKAK